MPSRSSALLIALAALLLASCGRPATVAECEEIVERIARLKLQEKNAGSSATVEAEVEAAKKALNDTTMKHCVGRRITESALRCMREAKTSKEIVEECFD